MVFLQKHSEEIFWLNRRIEFLERLNQLIESEADYDDTVAIANEFKKVENPSDLVDRLKTIYGNELP